MIDMSEQTVCPHCDAAYDASIFLPGQPFSCISCNAEVIATPTYKPPAPKETPDQEPDTQIYQVPEAFSRELLAAGAEPEPPLPSDEEATKSRAASSHASLDDQMGGYGDEATLGDQQHPDVIVRGQRTIHRDVEESGELPTIRAAGFVRSRSSRDDPTSISPLGPDMIAVLEPLEFSSSHVPEPHQQGSLQDYPWEVQSDAAPDDDEAFEGTIPSTPLHETLPETSLGGSSDAMSSESLLTVPPVPLEDAAHTLQHAEAVDESTLDSFQDLQSVQELVSAEELELPLDEDVATGVSIPAVPQKALEEQEEETTGQLFSAQTTLPPHSPLLMTMPEMPSYPELAQVLEGAGPLVRSANVDSRTQMEVPAPSSSPDQGKSHREAARRPVGARRLDGALRLDDALAQDRAAVSGQSDGKDIAGEPLPSLMVTAVDSDSDEYDVTPWTPGGFWRRGVAWLIDVLLVYGGSGLGLWWWLKHWPPALWMRGGIFDRLPPPFLHFLTILVAAFGCILLLLLVNTIYFGIGYKTKGTSPGKALLGLQVLHAHTNDYIGFRQTFLREVIGKFLSVLLLLGGLLMVAFRKDKLSLHDLVFTTKVVMRPKATDKGEQSTD